ncbi:MAG: CCA tRNA nucleotidyltransferase [Chloroflexi bacterium]|nr:CCA tRNA nucleotidyltransferase [Chloroflexota bacterium]
MRGPGASPRAPSIDSGAISAILGEATARLIELIAEQAQAGNLRLFLVGGVIRDLLLKRPNHDLDFVLESDAIAFAEALAAEYGGASQAHKAFGTASWRLDSALAEKLDLPGGALPGHIDFARARAETYAGPGALPSVMPSGIERDLWRRDFTLNALALQLSPAQAAGKLLDVSGGLSDLERKRVRILHDKSFIDDPTRVFRALRFARRYDFTIERETAALMKDALPALERVSGIRLSHEIELILQETTAVAVMLDLQDLGALARIHPAFRINSELDERLRMKPDTLPRWTAIPADDPSLNWSLLLADVGESDVGAICGRLDLTQALTRAVVASAELVANASALADAAARPSEIARLLDGAPEVSLLAAWTILSQRIKARQNIDNYVKLWRQLRPVATGNDLKRMGIPPGPRYKVLLDALRSAWIDGDISTQEEEALFLQELLAKDN